MSVTEKNETCVALMLQQETKETHERHSPSSEKFKQEDQPER